MMHSNRSYHCRESTGRRGQNRIQKPDNILSYSSASAKQSTRNFSYDAVLRLQSDFLDLVELPVAPMLILMHSISCLLQCVSEMLINKYLLSTFRSGNDKPSKRAPPAALTDVQYAPVDSCEQTVAADAHCGQVTTGAVRSTINECNDPLKLSQFNVSLENRLSELRDKYKQLCARVETTKARRHELPSRDKAIAATTGGKTRQIIGPNWTLDLPEPLNRYERDQYVRYLLKNALRELHDISNVVMGELLDDDVITTVMKACQRKQTDILFVNPCITQCIQCAQHTDEIRSLLDPIQAKRYTNVFFVVNDTQNGSRDGTHWSLLLLSRDAGTFCHYDSLRGINHAAAVDLSRKLSDYFDIWQVCDIDCEQQTNATDCGIYVLDNMLRLILVLKNDVNVDEERITIFKICKLPASFTKTRIYMMNTYVEGILQKVKKSMRLRIK